MNKDLQEALSTRAHIQYSKHWASFYQFATKHLKRPSLPASANTLALYTTHLHHTNLQSSTIRTHLSAIAFYHKINGFTSPTSSFLVTKLLTAYSKRDSTPKTRQPINHHLLTQMFEHLNMSNLNRYNKILYKAVFSLMYHAALRVSEVAPAAYTLHHLHANQLTFKHHDGVTKLHIAFHSYKHNTNANTNIILPPKSHIICPVKAYRSYQKLRPRSSPLAFCNRDATPLNRRQIASQLKYTLSQLGFNPKFYNTHSFRIGKATDMAIKGHSTAQIALAGRWSSNAYQLYIKPNSIQIP